MWGCQSDLLCARIIACCLGDRIRAHPDSVYIYQNGAFNKQTTLPIPVVRLVEQTLITTQFAIRSLAKANLPNTSVQDVIRRLGGLDFTNVAFFSKRQTYLDRDDVHYDCLGWLDKIECLRSMMTKLTNERRGKGVIEIYGNWCQEPMLRSGTTWNYDNATIAIGTTTDGNGRIFVQKPKSPQNNCYTNLGVSLAYTPSDDTKQRLRRFLCTVFAGGAKARLMDATMEALAWMNEIQPHILLVLIGPGGDGKSSRSILRANVMGARHGFLSANAFQKDDEFRVQGIHFVGSLGITVQECQPGKPLIEDVMKVFISGGELSVQPKFGVFLTD